MIPASDWNNVKNKVLHLSAQGLTFQTIGSIFIGGAISSLIGALALNNPETYLERIICWAIFFTTILIGTFSLFIASRERKSLEFSRDDIAEEMDRILHRYIETSTPILPLNIKLTNQMYELIYNPDEGHKKNISFDPSGLIGSGQNKNEYRWSIEVDEVIIYNHKGEIFSKFKFDQIKNRFVSNNGIDTICLITQYIEPI